MTFKNSTSLSECKRLMPVNVAIKIIMDRVVTKSKGTSSRCSLFLTIGKSKKIRKAQRKINSRDPQKMFLNNAMENRIKLRILLLGKNPLYQDTTWTTLQPDRPYNFLLHPLLKLDQESNVSLMTTKSTSTKKKSTRKN